MNLEQAILSEILKGELPAGTRLNVAELKGRFQVGLAPLREALSRLVATGLLESVHNKGFFVTPVSRQDCRETYETFAHVETLALSQAMAKGGDRWEEGIVSSLYHLAKLELADQAPEFEEWYAANARFHDSLVEGCSPVVQGIRQQLFLRMTRYVHLAYQGKLGELKEAHRLHRELADTVLSGKKDLAIELIKKHMLEGLDAFETKIRN